MNLEGQDNLRKIVSENLGKVKEIFEGYTSDYSYNGGVAHR